jgi:hypothetical protein
MGMQVAVIGIDGSRRSHAICEAFGRGLRFSGEIPVRMDESRYVEPLYDAAIFYGLRGNLPKALKDYPAAGKAAIYVDLGYWGRLQGGRLSGFHKISLNSRHPTAYFRRHRHANDRSLALGIRPAPWRSGRHILIAGMGDKAAVTEGYAAEQWEREAIAELRRHTDRPIVYRPKPSWRGAKPIEGAAYSPPTQPLEEVFRNCHAVVTHHSNVAVDALVAGIPVFSMEGVASPMGMPSLDMIESPLFPEDREQWIADLAYTQWTVDEIRSGAPWRHLKCEGLIP